MCFENTRQPFRSPGGYHRLWPWRLAPLPSKIGLSLWNQSASRNVILQAPDTALDSSHSYVTWIPISFLALLAFILQFHARNWDFCGADSLALQRLLSFAVMPWDSVGRVCNQSYTIKEKSWTEEPLLHMEEQESYLLCPRNDIETSKRAVAFLPPPLSLLCPLWVSCRSSCGHLQLLPKVPCLTMGVYSVQQEVTLKTVLIMDLQNFTSDFWMHFGCMTPWERWGVAVVGSPWALSPCLHLKSTSLVAQENVNT